MINIEIKAKCNKPNRIRKILVSKSADFKGTDHQIDTYFKVKTGRLKLREGNIENGLIYYERENTNLPKQSNYLLYKTNPHTKLKEILKKDFEILIIVDKQREIYFIENIKFHIDTVEMLGSFVEIEATDGGEKIERDKLEKQCRYYMSLFGIEANDLISCSYSDMIMKTLVN
jgi:predicted adenylyl cyclase CyaB